MLLLPGVLAVLQCVAMSTAQKVSDLPASLQKIVGAFQMVCVPLPPHNCLHACMHSQTRKVHRFVCVSRHD